jgi:hypothetical protein
MRALIAVLALGVATSACAALRAAVPEEMEANMAFIKG